MSDMVTDPGPTSARAFEMPIQFEDLDDVTRRWMLDEFLGEQQSDPYPPAHLSPAGRAAWPELCAAALEGADEENLAEAMADSDFWIEGTNVEYESRRLAVTEFNTWYVRGLARRLLEQGQTDCEVYGTRRGGCGPPNCSECVEQWGRHRLDRVYAGHRADYWGNLVDPDVVMVPFHPHCDCTIRPIRSDRGQH